MDNIQMLKSQEKTRSRKGKLALFISDKCNNKCIHCFVRGKEAKEERIIPKPITSYENILPILLSNRKNYEWLILSGNEPTLNKNLFKILKTAKEIDFKIELKTNGRMLSYKSYVKRVLGLVDLINISLVSHIKQVQNKITQSESYDQTLKGITNVLYLMGNKNLTITIVITKLNLSHLEDMVKFLLANGVKSFSFNFLFSSNKKLLPRIEDIKPVIGEVVNIVLRAKAHIGFYGFPLCALGRYWKYSTELLAPPTTEYGCKIEDSKKLRLFSKRKFKKCVECSLNDKCEGVWFPYHKVYGENEK